MSRTVLGKVSLTPKGTYSASTPYGALDVVAYEGSSYLALKDIQGVTPTNDGENWMLLAEKGDQGDQGDQGIQGLTGEAAGFGTVTATVDDTSGTPAVNVQTDGPDTAKNMTFAFTGIKGTKGDEGASFTRLEKTAGTSAPGSVDTYTAYNSDDEEAGTIQVYNGADGSGAGDFKADGTVPMTGNLQMGGNKVTGVAEPTEDTDGATKGYVDDAVANVAITTDATPTEDSENPVQSGGVFDALAGKADLTLSNLSNRQKALHNIGGRPNQNLLRNWYFAGGGTPGKFPINTNGQMSYSGSGIGTINAWRNIGNSVTTINDDGVSFTAIVNSNLRQILGIPNLDGLTLTATILYESITSGTCNLIVRNSVDTEIKRVSTINAGLLTTTFQVPEGSGRISFESNASAGVEVKLISAKLELGNQQTLAYQDEDGNWQLFETPDYATEYVRCASYDDDGVYLGPVRGLGLRVNKNLLDNWYFVGGGSQQGGGQFPIKQKSETSWNGKGYHLDRWVEEQNVAGSIGEDGYHIGAGQGVIQKHTEAEMKQLLGKTVTVSCLLSDGSFATATGTLPEELTANFNITCRPKGNVNFSLSLFYSAKSYQFGRLYNNSGSEITVVACKTELGPTQTLAYQDEDGNWQLFETPEYTEELAKCQYYLFPVMERNKTSATTVMAQAASSTSASLFIPLPCNMRVNPTVTVNGTALCELTNGNTQYPITSITVARMSSNVVKLNITCSGGGLTAGNFYPLTNPDADSYLFLSAEL